MDDLAVFDRKNDRNAANMRNRKVHIVGGDEPASGTSTDTLQPATTQADDAHAHDDADKDEVVYGKTPDGKSEPTSPLSRLAWVEDCRVGWSRAGVFL